MAKIYKPHQSAANEKKDRKREKTVRVMPEAQRDVVVERKRTKRSVIVERSRDYIEDGGPRAKREVTREPR